MRVWGYTLTLDTFGSKLSFGKFLLSIENISRQVSSPPDSLRRVPDSGSPDGYTHKRSYKATTLTGSTALSYYNKNCPKKIRNVTQSKPLP